MSVTGSPSHALHLHLTGGDSSTCHPGDRLLSPCPPSWPSLATDPGSGTFTLFSGRTKHHAGGVGTQGLSHKVVSPRAAVTVMASAFSPGHGQLRGLWGHPPTPPRGGSGTRVTGTSQEGMGTHTGACLGHYRCWFLGPASPAQTPKPDTHGRSGDTRLPRSRCRGSTT